MAYTNNVPQANQQIAATQGPINANFDYIQKAVGQEHNFLSNDTDPTHTYHLQASMPNRADPGSLPPGTKGMFYVNGGEAKFYNSSGAISRLSEGGGNATSGFQWIGQLLLQYGEVTGLSGSWPTSPQTYEFSTGNNNIKFPNKFIDVIVTLIGPSSSSNGDISINSITQSNGSGKTQFVWQWSGSSGASFGGFYFIALGF